MKKIECQKKSLATFKTQKKKSTSMLTLSIKYKTKNIKDVCLTKIKTKQNKKAQV